jgi:hemolysin activation/secretion protein
VSSDIQNTASSTINDYNNSFITTKLDYSNYDYAKPLFFKKSSLYLKTGFGKRQANNQISTTAENQQLFIELEAMHTFYLNDSNNINIKSHNYFLRSSDYFTNELYRFGGLNSIRGFTENSLTANLITSILTEYRHVVSSNLYVHTILDYCRLQAPNAINNLNKNQNLLGVGFGIGLQTTNGLLKVSLANGGSENQKNKFSNTIVHLSYAVKF